MPTRITKTLLVVVAMVAAAAMLTGCSGGSTLMPDTVGEFKVIAIGDSTAYKSDHWPQGGENLATSSGEDISSKIGSPQQYLDRFKSYENEYISQSIGNDNSKISNIQYYRDPSGLEVAVFTTSGPASDRPKLCDAYLAGTTNSDRTIWRDNDQTLCAVLKDTVVVATTLPQQTGPSQHVKPSSKSFLDTYSAMLTKSGNLAANQQ